MRFLYLKLGKGNRQAEYWLQQRRYEPRENVFKKPAVAIFFRKTTTEFCRKLITMSRHEVNSLGARDERIPKYTDIRDQIKPFFEAGDKRNARFVTIVSGKKRKVYIYEPVSEAFDMPERYYDEYDSHLSTLRYPEAEKKTKDEHFPKVMYVKNIQRFEEFPHVLATLPCSQYLTRGTCREIKPSRNWGAIQAIKHCLGEAIDKPGENGERLMSLLGWHQLETLVFLILKNAGVHPSAWRAGTLPDIDMVATNYTKSEIKIGTNPQIVFEPMQRRTFQIKRGRVTRPFDSADYTIAINARGNKNDKILGPEWLREQIESQQDTKDWFEKSLLWTQTPSKH